MVQMVATDLDGTLLRSDKSVSPRTRRAVARVERAGLGFVMVTGRPPRWLSPVTDQLDHRGVAICANGALVLDLHTGEVVQHDPFDAASGRDVVRAVRRLGADVAVGVEWPDGFASDPRYPRGKYRRSEAFPGAAHDAPTDDDLFARPVVKILVRRLDDGHVEDLVAEAAEVVGDQATLTWSDLGLLEMSAPGVTKASALQRYAAEHGVAADGVLAFGDMPNDLPMLRWAGRSVAVANAHPSVREVADEVTAANDEDGVAVVLERLLAEDPAAA